ncbi:MAG: dihydroxyacetone kinase subunit L, partial [Parcubacteria group bacterium]|nr:dihydroxyacetone kinase subunit L [Parcubacteria group bacterium]
MKTIYNQNKTINTIKSMAEIIAKERHYLDELDRKIGDGEHGTSMNRGFTAVIEKLPELEDKCIGTILKTVGLTLMSTVGGASGALYGSAFLSAGNRMIGKKELTLIDIIEIFNTSLEAIYKYGKAKIGDKTIVDTLA